MATLTQDQRFVGVTVSFFDANTPPRAAMIDVADRQPTIVSNDPTVIVPSNLVVAADGMSLSFDVDSVGVGSAQLVLDVDVNLISGADESLVLTSEVIDVTPGAAGQAVSASFTFPAASPKP